VNKTEAEHQLALDQMERARQRIITKGKTMPMRTIVVGVEQEPRVQFKLAINGEPPGAIRLPDGSVIALRGKYASPGNNYSYFRIEIVEPSFVDGDIIRWEKNTKLTD